MPLSIVGGILAALGIISALLLVLAPLGAFAGAGGLSLWVLFPLFTLVGYAMLATSSRDPAARAPTTIVSAALLLIALAAAVALVAAGGGLVTVAGTASLWYVMMVAGLLGAIGGAVAKRTRASA